MRARSRCALHRTKGHRVVGVDISPNGIRDLKNAAAKESLAVDGVVADIATYTPGGMFDVVLVDRTLHMLATAKAGGVPEIFAMITSRIARLRCIASQMAKPRAHQSV